MSSHTTKPTTRIRVEDVAAELGISLSSAYRHVRKHVPPRINGRFMLTPEWLPKLAWSFKHGVPETPSGISVGAPPYHAARAARTALLAAKKIVEERNGAIVRADNSKLSVVETSEGFVIRHGGKRSVQDSLEVFADKAAAKAYLYRKMLADIGRGLTAPDGWARQHPVDRYPDELNKELAAIVLLVQLAMEARLESGGIEWGAKRYPTATKSEVR